MMMKPLRLCAILCAMMLAGGCRLFTGSEDPEACQQTYEFGNSGCARLVLIVEPPPQPWPSFYRWDARATPAREGTGADVGHAARPGPGMVPIQLTRWHHVTPGSGDTASVWVSARLLEDPRPIQPGVPLPTYAADSVLHVVRFAPVGSRPPVDTVRLTLEVR